jgi:GNAT superfamily N-acetyltransferase
MNNSTAHALQLNKANRLLLGRIFRFNTRVDFSIDCVVEGQMGEAYADDPLHPTAFRISVGPFWYFAGDAHSPGGRRLMSEFPAYNLLMPSPDPWTDVAKEMFNGRLQTNTRHRFSGENLSVEHLASLRDAAGSAVQILAIDSVVGARLSAQGVGYFDISDFESAEDFAQRGLGYCAMSDNQVIGVAYSSLVCSRGIEVSIFVEEDYRRRGVATALAASLLATSLGLGLYPNWDAANPESVTLAQKVGYDIVGPYEAYYYTAG